MKAMETRGHTSYLSVALVPVSIVLGILLGVICGLILVWFFKKIHMRDSAKILLCYHTPQRQQFKPL